MKMSIQEKRQLLDSFLKKGQIVSVEFIKADNTITKRTVRLWEEAKLSSGDRNDVQVNSTAHKPEIYTTCEVGGKGGWCKFNLNKLLSATLGGKYYEFDI